MCGLATVSIETRPNGVKVYRGGTKVRKELPQGPKTINVLSDHIVRNGNERTDRHPMFIVRFDGMAYFAKAIEGGQGSVRAVCGCHAPLPKVDPFGVGEGKVVAWIETDAPLDLVGTDDQMIEVPLPTGSYCGQKAGW